jgi:hypothetical protein
MAQSASYIYGSVSATNWLSNNTEFVASCTLGNSGVSYFSSGTSLGCTNIPIGPSGAWLGSANIFVGPSGAWLGRSSTNFILPSYGGIEVECSDILTTGATRILPEPLNRATRRLRVGGGDCRCQYSKLRQGKDTRLAGTYKNDTGGAGEKHPSAARAH